MQYISTSTITERQRQRQRERKVRDTQKRMGMVQGQAGRVRKIA